ncbi:DNA primase [Pseudoxanthomonas sp. 10H]|uniref:DNA primase n=1 Tax=Pseudoxanthomonas sp. 10H TaxID=3242729 RepID=UPI00355710EF
MTEFAFSLQWERLGNEGSGTGLVTERARVFGGWLVRVGGNPSAMAVTFVPDGQGRWDGEDFGEDDYEYEEEDGDEDEEEDEDLDDDEDADEDEDEEDAEEDAR